MDVLPIDMKSSKSIDTLAKTLLDRHKCIDVLVNCAGVFPMSGQTPLEGGLTPNPICIATGTEPCLKNEACIS